MLTKKKLISLLGGLICLILWVFGFQFISFIIMLIGWIIIIRDYPLGKKIGHTSWAITFFIIFIIISSFRIFELRTDFSQPCWSPDGKQIAFFMTKSLFRVQPGVPFSAWTSIDLWKKYYLCTMDYDGKNFKQVKQTEQATDEISWSGSGEIVFPISTIMDLHGFGVDGIYTLDVQSNNIREALSLKKGHELVYDPWLSKDKKFLGYIFYYRLPYVAKDGIEYSKDKYRLVIKDIQTNKDKLVLDQKYDKYSGYAKFYGAYDKNLIIYEEQGENKWTIYDLDKEKKEPVTGKLEDIKLQTILDMRTISPNRKMYAGAGGVWTVDNKIVLDFYIKPKRSYLINIFWK